MKTRSLLHVLPLMLMGGLTGAGLNDDIPAPKFRGLAIGGYHPMYTPPRTRFKGYMRENRRSTFNKNR